MTLDLLIAVIATACAAIVIAALTLSTPASHRPRGSVFASVLTAWFFAAVALAVTGTVGPEGLGTPGLGIAVLLPILAIAFLASRVPVLRNALYGIPLSVLIGVNALQSLRLFLHHPLRRRPPACAICAERRLG